MALKPCKECGSEVSAKAETCPHCGVKNPARRAQIGCGTGCLGLLVIVFGFGVVGSMMDGGGSASSTSYTPPTPGNAVFHVRAGVNVRAGPGTNNAVAYTLSPGDRTYLGTPNHDGWSPVHSGPAVRDTIGWLLRSLATPGQPPDLLLVSMDWEAGRGYEPAFIVGEVLNLSGQALGYVSITCALFDGQGRQIGSTLTNMNNLRSGDTWRFRAVVTEDDATRYRCDAPEGF